MSVLAAVRRVGLSVFAVLAAALLVAACSDSTSGSGTPLGGGAGGTSGAATGGGSSAAAGGTSAAAPTTAASGGGGGVAVSSSPATGGGGGGAAPSDFCSKAKAVTSFDFSQADLGTLKTFVAKLNDAAAAAPSAIKSDIQAIADLFNSIVQDQKAPTAAQIQDLIKHQEKVSAYVSSHCG